MRVPPVGRLIRNTGRGQSLAEFALVFPVFMLVLGGIIQFGIVFWGQNTLNQVVRDAGRYAATVADCSTASLNDIVAKTQQIQAATPFSGTYGAITVTLPTVDSDACPPTSNAEVVWVAIKAEATVPIFFPLIPSGTISSEAKFRMEPQVP